jgi:hypothetical protein
MKARMCRPTKRCLAVALIAALVIAAGLPTTARPQTGDGTRVFDAPMDRVWTVARSTLIGRGWEIDQEDRDGGWIRTKSRRVEGEDYGVYAKGTRQRVRLVLKALDPTRTQVTVERRVWKQERILWMDKEEDLPATDQQAEKQLLDAIAAAI